MVCRNRSLSFAPKSRSSKPSIAVMFRFLDGMLCCDLQKAEHYLYSGITCKYRRCCIGLNQQARKDDFFSFWHNGGGFLSIYLLDMQSQQWAKLSSKVKRELSYVATYITLPCRLHCHSFSRAIQNRNCVRDHLPWYLQYWGNWGLNLKENENMNVANLVSVFDKEVHLLLQISAELVTISNIFIICSTHELSQVKRWGIWPYADYLRIQHRLRLVATECLSACLIRILSTAK